MLYTDFYKKIRTCPFCVRDHKVMVSYDTAYITYALAPYHPHHLLVIPQRHVTSFLLLDAEESEEISALLRLCVRILHQHGYKDCAIMVKDGQNAGKSIRHLHYHVIPNVVLGDIDHKGDERRILNKAEIRQIVRDIRISKQKLDQRSKHKPARGRTRVLPGHVRKSSAKKV